MSIFSSKIAMKKFLLKTLIYIAVLLVITLGINALYICNNLDLNSDIGAFANGVPQNIQICNFGSSHGLYGFNYITNKYICFNFALSSQTLMYDNNILQYYKNKIQKGAYVFIVISYFSFLGKPEIEGEDFASKNRRYYKILPSDLIKQYDWKTNIYVNYLPALITGTSNLIKTLLLMEQKSLYWDQVTDATKVYKDAQEACKRHIITNKLDKTGKLIYNQEAFDAVYNMIKNLREIGARPILVTTPFLDEYNFEVKRNRPDFLDVFYAIVGKIAKDTDVKYYDYSHDKRFNNNYPLFANSDHLNREGAKVFTKILLREALGIID